MIILAAIGQLLLFFVFWRILHWITMRTRSQLGQLSLLGELVVNVVIALVLVIVAHSIHSAWWLLIIFGAAVGVFTGNAVNRSRG